MAKAHAAWTVLPHRPLERLADGLWRVEGDLPGMPITRVATVARLADGRLVIHNGIGLADDALAELERAGEPAFLLVPNGWHRLDAAAYKRRYPSLRVLCPAGARKRVAEVVAVDGDYRDFPADPTVALRHLGGVGEREGVLSVRAADGVSLAFNDVVFNQPHLPGVFGFIYRLIGSSGGPRVPRMVRLALVKDKRALAADLAALAALPDLRRVIVMHGRQVDDGAADFLRAVAATL